MNAEWQYDPAHDLGQSVRDRARSLKRELFRVTTAPRLIEFLRGGAV